SLRLAARLKANDYELAVDMHGHLRTALATLATGAAARIGFDRPRAKGWQSSERTLPANARRAACKRAREGPWLAHTHDMTGPTVDLHGVDRYLSVGGMLGLDAEPADFYFPVRRAASERIAHLLERHGAGANLLTMAAGTI